MSEQGSITVVASSVVALVLVMAAGLGVAGQLVAGWSQTATAADAAALAAAPATFLGSPVEEASRIAAANGSRLISCMCPVDRSFATRTVEVRTETRVQIPVLGDVAIRATSRAEFDPMAGLQD